jgi:hypothetical protein
LSFLRISQLSFFIENQTDWVRERGYRKGSRSGRASNDK